MKLSLKVAYACQVLAQLGRVYGRSELPHIEDLAQIEAIPANYLVQILNELRNAGLIISRRGKLGGYALAREPEDIHLADILRAVEGEVLELTTRNSGVSAERVAMIWGEVSRSFTAKLQTLSVADMMQAPDAEMYHI